MITLKSVRAEDIPTLLDLWNMNLGEEFPLTEKLLRQTMESDPYYESEGHLIAWKDATAVGWVLCKSMKNAGAEVGRFAGRGGIGALCVHPDFQRQGIGTQL
ncbi:MAG: GNAT family N-acetyltransferase, partial [Abditibacteriaceae bacterium]